MKYVILATLMSLLAACGSAQGNDMHVQYIQAQDGTNCYVLIQNGVGTGLSCK